MSTSSRRMTNRIRAMPSPTEQHEVDTDVSMPEPPLNWPRTSENANDNQQEEEQMTDSTSDQDARRNTRGPTLMHKGWAIDGGILQIEVNEFGQPIEEKASRLASNLGVLARNGILAPLTYTDWRIVPAHIKDNIWKQIKENTNATDGMKGFLLSSLSKKWKDWKAKVKKQGYDAYNTNEERLASCPTRVEEDQWRTLVYHWDTAKAQVKSVRNKASRAQLKMPHTSGRKSSAQVRNELLKETGRRPTRMEVHKKMHALKDGKPYSETAKKINDAMDNLALQNPETAEDGYTQDDIYGQVMGPERHGRVRTFGLGVSPTVVFGSNSNRFSQVERRETERRHQLELERIQREMEAEFERKQVEMETQMRAMMEAQMENQLKEKVDAIQIEIENKMQAKMQEKFEAYLSAIRSLPRSPQDVSSGTGQVPDESSVERQTPLAQQHQQEKQMERPVRYQPKSHQQPRQQTFPQIISRSQLLNYREERVAKKAKK